MRLFVFFDLPTNTPKQRKQATQFRNMLIKEAFMMLQYSVYVRVLQITDKQYERMILLIGEETREEKCVGMKQLLLF